MARIRFALASARCRAISTPFSICVTAVADSSVAAACVWAPFRIWSIATIIWAAERLISCTDEDSSSDADATSSALFEISVEFLRSSANSERFCAARSHSRLRLLGDRFAGLLRR